MILPSKDENSFPPKGKNRSISYTLTLNSYEKESATERSHKEISQFFLHSQKGANASKLGNILSFHSNSYFLAKRRPF